LTEVLGEGPTAVATALIPDLHHFRGSFGGAHIIPLWRNADGTDANITAGVLEVLSQGLGIPVSPEDLFAYVYAILFSPDYVQTFWDELTIPGPRVPITRSPKLFQQTVQLGRKLLWLHTYGERFVPSDQKAGRIPPGKARCKVGTPSTPEEYPEDFSYSYSDRELRVGKGIFENVRPQVWEFSVSGFEVVKSWLGYRMRNRKGKKSSPLDDIRPETWEFDEELLDLLWVLDHTIDLFPQLSKTLRLVLNGDIFTEKQFPQPTQAERKGPKGVAAEMPLFASVKIEKDKPKPNR